MFRLDPTHVREYPSKEAFLRLLEKEGFNPTKICYSKVKRSIVNVVLRVLIMIKLSNPESIQHIFLEHRLLAGLARLLQLPVLGYERIEVLASLKRDMASMK